MSEVLKERGGYDERRRAFDGRRGRGGARQLPGGLAANGLPRAMERYDRPSENDERIRQRLIHQDVTLPGVG